MAETPDCDDESPDENPPEGGHTPPAKHSGAHSLEAFSTIQRHLAAIDFAGLTAAQRAIESLAVSNVPAILAAQDSIAKHFMHSINFEHLIPTYKALLSSESLIAATAAQTQWAEALSKAIDFSALREAAGSISALTSLTDANKALLEPFQRQADTFAKLNEAIAFRIPEIDFSHLLGKLDRWIPSNLRQVDDLNAVATVALDEGLPLAWIPRPDLVDALVAAENREARQQILQENKSEILDDCEAALSPLDGEWSHQCRAALGALRAGFDSPAQSHAGNIVDSIVLRLHGKTGRDDTKKFATQDFDEQPLQLAAENLTLRPLFRAFAYWWPWSGDAPPDHFARHATAHAVGHVGVFQPHSALIAVMLATSLIVQYANEDPASAGESDHSS